MRKLVENRVPAIQAKDLTPEQDKHFSGWITALFETEAINDELMSTCSPQEFYEMIPLMFSQMVLAVKANALDGETLKSGLGCKCFSEVQPKTGNAEREGQCYWRHRSYRRWSPAYLG